MNTLVLRWFKVTTSDSWGQSCNLYMCEGRDTKQHWLDISTSEGACRDSGREAPTQRLNMPDCTQTPGYWNGSIKCSCNKSSSRPVSNPFLFLLHTLFSPHTFSPFQLPCSSFLVLSPFVIRPQKCVLPLVKPGLPSVVSHTVFTCSLGPPRPAAVRIIALPFLCCKLILIPF